MDEVNVAKFNALKFSDTLRNINCWYTPGTVATLCDSLPVSFPRVDCELYQHTEIWGNLERGGITSVDDMIGYVTVQKIAACGLR